MVRHGLSDEEWALVEDCFPPVKPEGRPPMPRRQAFEAICWIVRTGAGWRDLPEELGPWETVYGHFNKWSSDGTLAKAFQRLKDRFSEDERFDHSVWAIDGTITRAHRCAGGGGKKGIHRNPQITHWAAHAGVSRQKFT
jgi:transposase